MEWIPWRIQALDYFVYKYTNLHDDVIFACYRLVLMVISENIILTGINLHEKPRESKELKLDHRFFSLF